MTRRKLEPEQRKARTEARWSIVQAANRYRVRLHLWHPYQARLFDLRHIQAAVSIARRYDLVAADVLVAAGFRPRP